MSLSAAFGWFLIVMGIILAWACVPRKPKLKPKRKDHYVWPHTWR